jgi:hypothetical protein
MLLVRIIWEVNIGMVRAKDHLFQAEVLFHPLHVTSEDHKGGKHKSGQSKCDMFIEHLFGLSEKSTIFFSIINFCTCSLHAYPDEPMFFQQIDCFHILYCIYRNEEEGRKQVSLS